MTLYAAYGTNLDPARMSERCPHSILQSTGWLTGWRMTFGGEEHGWDGALSTIVQDPFEQVFVAVYDVTPDDFAQAARDYVAAGARVVGGFCGSMPEHVRAIAEAIRRP